MRLTPAACFVGLLILGTIVGCAEDARERTVSASGVAAKASAIPSNVAMFGPGQHQPSQVMVPLRQVLYQYQCFKQARSAMTVAAQRGEPGAPTQEQAIRRNCVVAALCDAIDGTPDYFELTNKPFDEKIPTERGMAQSGGKLVPINIVRDTTSKQAAKMACHGVETWGPDMIAAKPGLFFGALQARDNVLQDFDRFLERERAAKKDRSRGLGRSPSQWHRCRSGAGTC